MILRFFLVALAASVYLVLRARDPEVQALPRAPAAQAGAMSDDEIEEEIEREVETGEFQAVEPPGPA